MTNTTPNNRINSAANKDEDAASSSGYSTDREETEEPETRESDDSDLIDAHVVRHDRTIRSDTNQVREESKENAIACNSSRKRSLATTTTSVYPSSSTTTSSLSGSDNDSTSDDSIVWKHKYLTKKRRVLQRASNLMQQDDLYAASVARQSMTPMTDSELWKEARELLGELDGNESRYHPSNNSTKKRVRIVEPSRKRLSGRIDLSFVQRFSSNEMMDADMKHFLLPTTLYDDNHNQWMPRALSQIQEVHRVSDDNETEKKTRDAILASRKPALHPTASTDLDQALALTPTAQLMAQAVPPFAVVHANRAFYNLSGIAPVDIVEKPIEDVVKLTVAQENDNSSLLGAYLERPVGNQKQMPCEIRVLSVHEPSSEEESAPFTHVLVQIYPSSSVQAPRVDANRELMERSVMEGSGVLLGIG